MCLNTVCQLVSRSIDHRLIDKSIGQFGASKYFHVCICLKEHFWILESANQKMK